MTRDVQEMIRALGYENAILVAHDWGGAIAWQVARYYPEVVAKIIVMNCPPGNVFRYVALKCTRCPQSRGTLGLNTHF